MSQEDNQPTESTEPPAEFQFSLRSIIMLLTFLALMFAFPQFVMAVAPASYLLMLAAFTLLATAGVLVGLLILGITVSVLLTPEDQPTRRANLARCLHVLFICCLAITPAVSLWVHAYWLDLNLM